MCKVCSWECPVGLDHKINILALLWEARQAEVNLIISTAQCLLYIWYSNFEMWGVLEWKRRWTGKRLDVGIYQYISVFVSLFSGSVSVWVTQWREGTLNSVKEREALPCLNWNQLTPKPNRLGRGLFIVKPARGGLFIAKRGSKATGGEEHLGQTKTSAGNVSNTKVTLYPVVNDRTEITPDLEEERLQRHIWGKQQHVRQRN